MDKFSLKVLAGMRDEKEARAKKKKEILRRIMLHCKDSKKIIHAAVRWYALRDKWETDSEGEFKLFNALLNIMAQFPPSWIAREFPATKDYDGDVWGCKDYFSSMEALREVDSFCGDSMKLHEFLWDWRNEAITEFVIAGMALLDELRVINGQASCVVEFLTENGVNPYYMQNDGAIYDHEGTFVGKARKPRHLHVVGDT